MLRAIFITSAMVLMAAAPTASALTATQSVFKEIVKTNAAGEQSYERVDANTIIPGDRVIYALSYANDAAEAADDIVLTMPIPEVINYIDGSANTDVANILYSVDGGASFGARTVLMVLGDNGVMRPASSEDITHIRWSLTEPISPGEQGELSFTGLLK